MRGLLNAGVLDRASSLGVFREGGSPWLPRILQGILVWLDAINEAARRGLSTPIFVDGFSRVDGAIGSAPTGQAYLVASGTWTVASGTARTAATDTNVIVTIPVSIADGRMSARIRTTSANPSIVLCFRLVNSNNFLCVQHSGAGLLIRKNETSVGSLTTLATNGAAIVTNTWSVLEVRFTGNQIDAYLNGVLTTQYTLSGADAAKFGQGSGAVGFGLARFSGTSATVEVDDLSISSGASSMLLDKWSDDSGNGFDFAQGTNTKMPLLTWKVNANGVVVPVVRGDAVDDTFAGPATALRRFPISMVAAGWNGTSNTRIFSNSTAATNAGTSITPVGALFGDGSGSGSSSRRSGVGVTPANFAAFVRGVNVRGATDMDLYLNGALDPVTYSGTGGAIVYGGAAQMCSGVNSAFSDIDTTTLIVVDGGVVSASDHLNVARFDNLRYGKGLSI